MRVVSVPGFSVELCGGTHCAATGDIGLFTIVEESGVAAGVRRVEALTGEGAIERMQRQRGSLTAVLEALRVGEDHAPDSIAKLQAEIRRLTRDAHDLRTKLATASGGGGNGAGEAIDINGVKAVIRRLEGLDKAGLRDVSDSLKSKLRSGVVVLASSTPDGKVGIVVSVTPDLKGRIHAGQIVKEIALIVGGGGGGRPDFAEAGGKDASKLDAMLEQSRAVIQRMTVT